MLDTDLIVNAKIDKTFLPKDHFIVGDNKKKINKGVNFREC